MLSYERSAAALARSGVTDVLVSLHAPTAGLQARLTNAAGSFTQTVAGIRNVLAAAGHELTVAVNTTVVRENVAALPALGRLLAGLGVTRWNLQVVTPFGRARASQVPPTSTLCRYLGAVLDRAGGDAYPDHQLPAVPVARARVAALTDFKSRAGDGRLGESGTNLQDWLAGKRRRDARCRGCLYAVLCPGFYRFEAS